MGFRKQVRWLFSVHFIGNCLWSKFEHFLNLNNNRAKYILKVFWQRSIRSWIYISTHTDGFKCIIFKSAVLLMKLIKFLDRFSDDGPRYCRPLFSALFQASPKFGLWPSPKFITFMSNGLDGLDGFFSEVLFVYISSPELKKCLVRPRKSNISHIKYIIWIASLLDKFSLFGVSLCDWFWINVRKGGLRFKQWARFGLIARSETRKDRNIATQIHPMTNANTK